MSPSTFPLFRPAIEEPPEDLNYGVSDLIDREVRRAALMGPDPDAVTKTQMTLDIPDIAIDALQALATAIGSSRRAMAGKLLEAAVWQAVNELHHHANDMPEYEAVRDLFTDAFNAAKQARAA